MHKWLAVWWNANGTAVNPYLAIATWWKCDWQDLLQVSCIKNVNFVQSIYILKVQQSRSVKMHIFPNINGRPDKRFKTHILSCAQKWVLLCRYCRHTTSKAKFDACSL
jgi:hypothetical protein